MDLNNTKMRESSSIDLIDLFKRIVIEWRAILIFSLIAGAALFAVFRYREMKKEKQQTEQAMLLQEQNENLSTEESLKASLTEDERNAVLLAVQNSEMIKERTEYLEGSVWLNEGTDAVKKLFLLLRIKGESQKVSYLKRFFFTYVYSSKFIEVLTRLSGYTNEAYAAELISADMMLGYDEERIGDPSIMSISVIIPKDADPEEVRQSVSKAVLDYGESLKEKEGEFQISIETQDIQERYDQNPSTRRRELLYEIYNLKSQMKATVDTFTSKQRMLYQKMTGTMSEEELTTVSASTAKSYGKGAFFAGILLAVFLYVCFSALLTLIQARIYSRKELTGIPCLGEVRKFRTKNALDGIRRSRLLYSLFYRKAASDKASTDLVKIIIKKRSPERLRIVYVGAKTELMQAVAADLIKGLSGMNISVSEAVLLSTKEAMLQETTDCEAILMLISAGNACYYAVKEQKMICGLCGTDLLGYVLCGE